MNLIERGIALVSPKLAFARQQYRTLLSVSVTNQRKYDAASKGRRTDGWSANGGSANTEISHAINWLRARSRDLVRNNPYAKKSLRVISNNTIGSGIRPSPIKSGNKQSDKKIKKLWAAWGEKKECDFDNMHNFYGLEKLVMKCVVESGEAIIRRRRVKGKTVPLQVQVIEPDYIDTARNWSDMGNGNFVLQGIEFDQTGKRVAYWLFDRHPGEVFSVSISIVSRRIPIEELAHVYIVERPGQIRGVPFMVSSMLRMRDFDEYEDAQLIRQKIAACHAAFVKDFDGKLDGLPGQKKSANGDLNERMEPGMITYLPAGKDITFNSPPGPENYESYSQQIKQGIAAGNGVSYESMTGDYSKVNFSSGRMGWLEMSRDVEDWQLNMIIPQLCETVWLWFVEAAIVSGAISREVDATWTVPRREMLDPVKESSALVKLIRAGLKPMPEAIREMGGDPEQVIQEYIDWQEKIDEHDLVFDTDARNDIKEPSADGADQHGAKKSAKKDASKK